MKDDNDYVWLIEQGQPEGYTPPIYYAFDQEKRGHRYPAWTTDPYKASPFRSRDLALAFMASHRDGDRPMPGRPVEHGFIPPRPADASVSETPEQSDLEAALERERDLRDERVRNAKFHIAHDGTVLHPTTCSGCRAFAERNRQVEGASDD